MDLKYGINIDWSKEDGASIVEAPELPGSMADGPTCHKAVANAQVIIHESIESAGVLVRPIPKAKVRRLLA